jgi:hypothetical protein
MPSDPLTAVLGIGSQLIDRLWPDPATRDAAKLEMLKMNQTGELAELTAATTLATKQIETNIAEAGSTNWFVAGWRPYIGWICGTGLGYQFLVYPILIAWVPKIVQLDMGTLVTLLCGMLGFGAMRTTEKIKGVA